MSIEKIIPIDKELVNIFGVNDQNLKYLKDKFKKIKINVKGNIVYITGDNAQTTDVMKILDEMLLIADRGEIIDIEDLKLMSNVESKEISNISSTNNISIIGSKSIKVKNVSQFKYIETIDNSTITFGIGPAGTGKTFLAVASAVKMYNDENIKKIVLTRPAVEAGERLGYLPGDLSQKIDPYLRPLYDALYEMLGMERVNKFIERNIIEVAPLAYMRGRTLNNAFIILDESQNTTVAQMKMFLTRIGFGSTAVVTGDVTQIDLPGSEKSGLIDASDVLGKLKGISFTRFSSKDVVRHPLVQKIVDAYARDSS